MGFKWIGVEVGNHADTHIVKRLHNVLDNSDKSGISKVVGWQGGGSFKYYHLGPSIITFNDKGEADFSWSLGKSFLEESFLSSYDYTLVADTSFLSADLFADKATLPKIGVQQVGSKTRVAVVSLNAPDGPQPTISFDELRSLYAALKAKFAPQYINVFTNRGVELAYDSKPDDLEVFKIPHAIFAELEK
jgi:adenine-specific DNA-methyltransferase